MSTSANLSGHIIRSHEDSKPPGHLLHQPGLKQQPQRPHRPPGQQAESSRAIHSGSSHQSVRYTSMNATSNGYQAQGSHHHHQQQHQQPPYAGPAEGWMANHGVPWWMVPPPNVSTVTPWSEEKIDELQDRLRLKLGPEFITQRPGPGGGPKLSYIEGWKLIALANDVFGFNGWSTSIISLTTDFMDVKEDGRCSVFITSIIRITLKDGCFHEDVGGGSAENVKGKAAALDKAKKEAVTDGIKRALKTFGNVLGLCLYDKEYNKQVAQMKVGPMPKLDVADLERHPHFRPPKPAPAVRPPVPPFKHEAGAQASASAIAQPSEANGRPASSSGDRQVGTPGGLADDSIVLPVGDEFDPDAFGEDSFLDGLDDSLAGAGGMTNLFAHPASDSMNAQNALAPPRQMPSAGRPSGPAYQHRHRPQTPSTTVVAGAVAHMNGPYDADSGIAAPRHVAPGAGGSLQQSIGGSVAPTNAAAQSTGTNGNGKQFGRVPSNGNINGMSKEDGRAARARALAISGAIDASTSTPVRQTAPSTAIHPRLSHAATPARPDSPQIPNGGIDAVASRASINYRSAASKLELEAHIPPAAKFGGFASARGMKRERSEGVQEQVSPTKRMLRADGQPVRPGPRRALGEIFLDGA